MPIFLSIQQHIKRISLVSSVSMIALSYPAVAQNEAQIAMSPQQITRSGIKTEAAVFAVASPAAQSSKASSAASVVSDQGLRLSGTVVGSPSATQLLSALVAGTVQAIHVSPLQNVKAGSAIVTLFSPQILEMQREYLQLATQHQLAQEKLARDDALFKEGIIAQSRVQDSRAQAIHAEVAMTERQQTLRAAGISDASLKSMLKTKSLSPNLTIVAKSSGAVLDLPSQLGQRIEAGMPIAKIAGNAPFWIDFLASRNQLEQIRVGELLQIKNCGMAKVMAISPQLDSSNQSVLVRAQELQHDGCIRLNQFVEATHIGSQHVKDSYGVPATAVIRSANQQYVFVRNSGGFEAVKVKVVSGSPDKIWVIGNLGKSPQVATQGIVSLKGAWLGLGAEDAPAIAPPAAAGSTGSSAANSTASSKTTSEKK